MGRVSYGESGLAGDEDGLLEGGELAYRTTLLR